MTLGLVQYQLRALHPHLVVKEALVVYLLLLTTSSIREKEILLNKTF